MFTVPPTHLDVLGTVFEVSFVGAGRYSNAYALKNEPDTLIVYSRRCDLKSYYATCEHWLCPKIEVMGNKDDIYYYKMPRYKLLGDFYDSEVSLAYHRWKILYNKCAHYCGKVHELYADFVNGNLDYLPEIKQEMCALLEICVSVSSHPDFDSLYFDLHDKNVCVTDDQHLILLDPIMNNRY